MKIAKLNDVKTPTRGTDKSAGLDFYTPNRMEPKTLEWGESLLIPSGITMDDLPEDTALIAFNKSGIAVGRGLIIGACVIDEDYQGEIHIHVTKVTKGEVTINPGEKITQFICVPVKYVDLEVLSKKELHKFKTTRGKGGFGHTGLK